MWSTCMIKRISCIHKKFKITIKSPIGIENVHKVIKFNQIARLNTNTKRGKNTKKKNDFKKGFFNLMNKAVFRKIMENMREHR